ncbi:MAG: UDP-N-acetylglucosamine 1-carboxyvinyltransferase [bacterium]
MKTIKIRPSTVKGTIKINGSKNSALPIIVGALLNNKKVKLKNIPDIKDINELIQIIEYLGATIKRKRNTLKITPKIQNKEILHESCKTFRASYYLMGLYLALFNHVKIYLPGGCNIGKRPIDFHLMGFEALGAKYKITDNIIEIALIRPTNAKITLPKKSLGATINLILLASRIEGLTTINNISLEPELIDFVNFMKKMGLKIYIEGTSVYIYGKSYLNKKIKYKIIPDRIEASTFICLGLVTNKVKVKKININHLNNILLPLKQSKANIKITKNSVTTRKSRINGMKIISAEYPKLSTDIFPLLLPVMAYSKDACKITETIYENRFEVCNELIKLGVNIEINNSDCLITGNKETITNEVSATDLRCAASLLIYAISTNKDIIIDNFNIIERGYENILKKLDILHVNYEVL